MINPLETENTLSLSNFPYSTIFWLLLDVDTGQADPSKL